MKLDVLQFVACPFSFSADLLGLFKSHTIPKREYIILSLAYSIMDNCFVSFLDTFESKKIATTSLGLSAYFSLIMAISLCVNSAPFVSFIFAEKVALAILRNFAKEVPA